MKKWICVLLTLALVCACALAETETPEEKAFAGAKQALVYMSEKKLGEALKLLKMEETLSEEELEKRISEQCSYLYQMEPQTEYAVAWTAKDGRYLAVPFEDPSYSQADAVVYILDEDYAFLDIVFAKWEQVSAGYGEGKNVVWNIAYTPDYIVLPD